MKTNSFSLWSSLIIYIMCFTFCKAQENKNTFEGGIISSKGLLAVQFQRIVSPLNENIGIFGSLGMGYTPGSHESADPIPNSFKSTVGTGIGFRLNKFRLGISGEYNKAIGDKAQETDANFDFISLNSYIGFYFGNAGVKLSYLPTLYTNQEYEQDGKNGFGFTVFLEF